MWRAMWGGGSSRSTVAPGSIAQSTGGSTTWGTPSPLFERRATITTISYHLSFSNRPPPRFNSASTLPMRRETGVGGVSCASLDTRSK